MQKQTDARGQSLSAFVSVVVLALLLVAGLVIDGGQQAAGRASAERAAQGAARAASDASATGRLAGRPDTGAALAAGRAYLAAAGVPGEVRVVAGRVLVHTRTSAPTIFLSLVGIGAVLAQADAEAVLVSR